jgi:hypothetical protein
MTDCSDRPLANGKAFLWILAAAIAAHGLLPFMEVVVSDDWFTLLADRVGSIKGAWEGAVFLSMPLTVLQALPFFLIGDNLLILRTVNFAVLVANGWVFYLLLCQLRAFDPRRSLIAAAVSVVFPGYLVHYMVSFLFYPLGILLFFSALLLVLKGECAPASRRLRYFLPAMMMVFYSFHLGALLVFYSFFIVAHFYFRKRLLEEGFIEGLASYLNRRYLFLLLPFWFWGFRQVFALFFPTWQSYNQPVMDRSVMTEGIRAFAANYGRMMDALLLSPWFFGSAAVLLFFLVLRRCLASNPVSGSPAPSSHRSGIWLFVGIAVLLAGIVPFILVGKHPQLLPIDWRDKTAFDLASRQILLLIDSRMDLFAGLAAGLIVVAALELVRSILQVPSMVCTALAFGLIVSSSAVQVSNYLGLEKKAIAMAAVRVALREDSRLKDTRVFGVVDRMGNVSTTWDSWVLYFREVWGDLEHFGVPERWYGEELNRSLVYSREAIINKELYGGAWFRYFKKPPFGSDQATLVLSHGPAESRLSPLEAFCRYHYLKHFAPERLSAFLADFTRVDILIKGNLERQLDAADYKNNWRGLALRLDPDGSSQFHLSSSTQSSSSIPGSEKDPKGPETLDDLGLQNSEPKNRNPIKPGKFVAVEFEFDRALTPSEVEDIVLVGERSGDLNQIRQEKGRIVTVFGMVHPDDHRVRYRLRDRVVPRMNCVHAFESPAEFDPGLVCIPKPYFFPEAVAPEKFVSVVSLTDKMIPSVFWREFGGRSRWPFTTASEGISFSPPNVGSSLSSDLIGFDSNRSGILFVDWPKSTSQAPDGILRLEDYLGRKILDVDSDVVARSNYVIIPAWPGLSGVSIRLLSRTGKPFLLPRKLALFQVDGLANLKTPLRDLVPR